MGGCVDTVNAGQCHTGYDPQRHSYIGWFI
uniref:Uncharacterized protein n=1 Tax=Anguilla anguilla TaxID=7936 RepID=A0A0E9SW26_ANGAN